MHRAHMDGLYLPRCNILEVDGFDWPDLPTRLNPKGTKVDNASSAISPSLHLQFNHISRTPNER